MNKIINELTSLLNDFNKDTKLKREAIKEQLQLEYDTLFDNDESLQKAIDLDDADNYGQDEGGIHRWRRYSALDKIPTEACEYLETYLSEHSIAVDWVNKCLKAYEGGSIVINDDGDVLDTNSGQWIVSVDDYETDAERNALIEAHMERTGHFSGVFFSDCHGNVFPVNTKGA